MADIDEVQDRIDPDRLIALTNTGTYGATTVNTTRLQSAIDDAIGAIARKIGSYNSANAGQVDLMVTGTVCKLLRRANPGAKYPECEEFKEGLEELLSGGFSRVSPATNSTLEPTAEDAGETRPVRPFFDRPRFRDRTPRKLEGG